MIKNEIMEVKSTKFINIVSVIIPLVVAILLVLPQKAQLGQWTKMLPHINAFINSLTSVVLVIAVWAIKSKKIELHQNLMRFAFVLGAIFLVFYVLYHLTNESTKFGGVGSIRYFYYFILISHILLSLVVLPFVLRAMYFAVTKQFAEHKKVTKIAFPIWLYVSVTGVIAYLMISPYYN